MVQRRARGSLGLAVVLVLAGAGAGCGRSPSARGGGPSTPGLSADAQAMLVQLDTLRLQNQQLGVTLAENRRDFSALDRRQARAYLTQMRATVGSLRQRAAGLPAEANGAGEARARLGQSLAQSEAILDGMEQALARPDVSAQELGAQSRRVIPAMNDATLALKQLDQHARTTARGQPAR
jgi:hypothetical protein